MNTINYHGQKVRQRDIFSMATEHGIRIEHPNLILNFYTEKEENTTVTSLSHAPELEEKQVLKCWNSSVYSSCH